MVDIMASNFWKGRYNLMNIYVGIDIAKHNHFAAAISFNTEIIIEPFNFSSQQKNPGNLAVPGHLTFGHTVSYDTKFILLSVVSDYSITVATRPDPTVRPPSRYQTDVLRCANGDFSCDLYGKIRIFHCVRMVFGDFVIIVLSQLLYIAPLV